MSAMDVICNDTSAGPFFFFMNECFFLGTSQEIRKLLAAMQESTLNGEPSADLIVGSRFRSEGGFKSTATRAAWASAFSR